MRATKPGPPLPASLNHALLGELAWLIGHETDAVKRAGKVLDRAKSEALGFDAHWDAVLSILAHSAALSRVFWPSWQSYGPRCPKCDHCRTKATPETLAVRDRVKTRGEFLRKLFNMPKKDETPSPLGDQSRTLRNTIEHWDERLDSDDWYRKIHAKPQRALFITPFERIDENTYPLRAFDPDTDTAKCGDQELPIRPLIGESERINYRLCQVIGYMVRGDDIWYYPPDLDVPIPGVG